MEKEKAIINREVTLTFSLNDLAKAFDYNLEVDEYEDVFHNGYTSKEVRKMDLRLPVKFDEANKIFPSPVAIAMENAERSAWAAAIRKYRIEALKDALEEIDLTNGGAEYQDYDGRMISAKAGITHVEANEQADEISVTILNPEHLINAVIAGEGFFSPDLSSTEPEAESAIKGKFHNLNNFFNVYGVRKPKGDLESQYAPDVDDSFFASELEAQFDQLTEDEAAEAVKEAVDSDVLEIGEALSLAEKLTKVPQAKIKEKILAKLNSEQAEWAKKLQ